MKYGEKFVLVPFSKRFKNPTLSYLSYLKGLDSQMYAIAHNSKLNSDEKVKLYNQILDRFISTTATPPDNNLPNKNIDLVDEEQREVDGTVTVPPELTMTVSGQLPKVKKIRKKKIKVISPIIAHPTPPPPAPKKQKSTSLNDTINKIREDNRFLKLKRKYNSKNKEQSISKSTIHTPIPKSNVNLLPHIPNNKVNEAFISSLHKTSIDNSALNTSNAQANTLSTGTTIPFIAHDNDNNTSINDEKMDISMAAAPSPKPLSNEFLAHRVELMKRRSQQFHVPMTPPQLNTNNNTITLDETIAWDSHPPSQVFNNGR